MTGPHNALIPQDEMTRRPGVDAFAAHTAARDAVSSQWGPFEPPWYRAHPRLREWHIYWY